MRRFGLAALLVGLIGCAPAVEEAVLVEPEPILGEDAARSPQVTDCDAVGDDGIGGTGCPALD